jgi:predicted nuclease of predicted toxin-antitoxin system
MKLLFDQNISFRILRLVSEAFPESRQVKALGLYNTPDLKIWEFAKMNGFVIVTFDHDFVNLANKYGSPPKVILLRTGNLSTPEIALRLLTRQDLIKSFSTSDAACLDFY